MMAVRKNLNDIHAYWFERISDDTRIVKKQPPFLKWFRSNRAIDDEIRESFGHLLNETDIPEGGVAGPRGRLSLIILFDQLVRNMYRGTPSAYAYDDQALSLTKAMIADESDRTCLLIERAFIYMPLMHSENLQDQELSVQKCAELLADSKQLNSPNVAYFKGNLDYARKYQRIIERFGRFPHRNEVLGRNSSPREVEFLCQ